MATPMGVRPPNVIVFLSDDQGYADLSCMGAPDLRTPHLDRLAASGVRFTDWYSNSPVCSPSRAALLTGRYPGNAGVRAILAGHRTASGLLPTVPTMPSLLRGLGYQTALVGKWHLGVAEGCRPADHGFEHWFGFLAGCIDYYSHIFYWDMKAGTNPLHDLWENGHEVWLNGRYFTDLVAERAVEWIRAAAARTRPFFLYVPWSAPHYPMHAPARYIDRFRGLPPERRIMAAMVSAMDDGVGAILDEVERQGLTEDTVVIFMSDNGPSRETRNWLDGRITPYYGGTTGPLKGHKFSLYEGGIRVPGIISWPGHIPSAQVLKGPAAAIDILPTILHLAGGDPDALELDGCDLWPTLALRAPAPQRDLFWEMDGQTAVRRGSWKLVLNGQLVEGAPPDDAVHLSNLDDDPGEHRNLARSLPALAAELETVARTWRAGIEERWEREWLPLQRGTATHLP